jgi:hypothetical protein
MTVRIGSGLANQVSFLNRAALSNALAQVSHNEHMLLDAQNAYYIDPDMLDLIRDFKDRTGPARGVEAIGTSSMTRSNMWTVQPKEPLRPLVAASRPHRRRYPAICRPGPCQTCGVGSAAERALVIDAVARRVDGW